MTPSMNGEMKQWGDAADAAHETPHNHAPAQKHGARKGKAKRAAKHGASGRKRANNSGTLEFHHGRWRARWHVTTPQGKSVVRVQSLAAKTVEEARKELAALTGARGLMSAENDLLRIRERIEGVRAERKRMEDAKPALALAEMFEAYAASPAKKLKGGRADDASPATMHQYALQAGRFVSWAAEHHPEATEMRQVTAEIAGEFLKHLASSVSGNTYNKYISLFDLIWRTLGDAARCDGNPWEGFNHRGKARDTGRRCLTVEELRRVCSSLSGEMRVLFAVGMYTGLRLGDCALMKWEEVDMARGVVVTTPRKTARHGTAVAIPMHPALHAVLDETPAAERRGFLMPQTAAKYRRDRAQAAHDIQQVFRDAGIKTVESVEGYARDVVKVGFHSLRHTFVSLAGNAGAPLALVQSLVGHANPMMTAHYFHAQDAAMRSVVAALPDMTGMTTDGGRAGDSGNAGESAAVRAFKAAWAAMTADERRDAMRWLEKEGN